MEQEDDSKLQVTEFVFPKSLILGMSFKTRTDIQESILAEARAQGVQETLYLCRQNVGRLRLSCKVCLSGFIFTKNEGEWVVTKVNNIHEHANVKRYSKFGRFTYLNMKDIAVCTFQFPHSLKSQMRLKDLESVGRQLTKEANSRGIPNGLYNRKKQNRSKFSLVCKICESRIEFIQRGNSILVNTVQTIHEHTKELVDKCLQKRLKGKEARSQKRMKKLEGKNEQSDIMKQEEESEDGEVVDNPPQLDKVGQKKHSASLGKQEIYFGQEQLEQSGKNEEIDNEANESEGEREPGEVMVYNVDSQGERSEEGPEIEYRNNTLVQLNQLLNERPVDYKYLTKLLGQRRTEFLAEETKEEEDFPKVVLIATKEMKETYDNHYKDNHINFQVFHNIISEPANYKLGMFWVTNATNNPLTVGIAFLSDYNKEILEKSIEFFLRIYYGRPPFAILGSGRVKISEIFTSLMERYENGLEVKSEGDRQAQRYSGQQAVIQLSIVAQCYDYQSYKQSLRKLSGRPAVIETLEGMVAIMKRTAQTKERQDRFKQQKQVKARVFHQICQEIIKVLQVLFSNPVSACEFVSTFDKIERAFSLLSWKEKDKKDDGNHPELEEQDEEKEEGDSAKVEPSVEPKLEMSRIPNEEDMMPYRSSAALQNKKAPGFVYSVRNL